FIAARTMTAQAVAIEPEFEEELETGTIEEEKPTPIHQNFAKVEEETKSWAILAVEAQELSETVEEPEEMLRDEEPELLEETREQKPATEPESFFTPPPAVEPDNPKSVLERPEEYSRQRVEAAPGTVVRHDARMEKNQGGTRWAAPSLFARVTGAAKALHAATSGGEELRKTPAPAGRLREPTLERGETQKPESPKAKTEPQPRLTGLDAAEKVRTAEAEEEMLDIPAFLRRQAN
ncbi:MAG: hypothetical protein R3245_05100, partial [Kiloniellales bacterium]|nr:hypothetical protein [Kiloniellales bacterium]